jgi:hypothetical protein
MSSFIKKSTTWSQLIELCRQKIAQKNYLYCANFTLTQLDQLTLSGALFSFFPLDFVNLYYIYSMLCTKHTVQRLNSLLSSKHFFCEIAHKRSSIPSKYFTLTIMFICAHNMNNLYNKK